MSSDAVLTAVNAIRSANIRQLTSPTWLEHDLLPGLGLSDAMPADHYPPFLREFHGTGLRSFQLPNQFSKYLCYLSKQKISSYLEVGVWQGGTFIITVEYLSRFNDIQRALAVDIAIKTPLKHYASLNDRVRCHEGDSKTPEVRSVLRSEWWDLALIDGDHTEQGCLTDYKTVRDIAGLVALHDIYSDICPAVTAVWQRIFDVFPRQRLTEFIEQYAESSQHGMRRQMGIGVIDLRGP